MTKKLHIKTYGCQMNVVDTQRMQDVLRPLGYEASESYEGAELVILNTCHIREKAEEKVYSDLGRVRMEKDRLAKAGTNMILAVGGCVAQAEGEEVMRRAPYVDMVFGPQAYHQLPELVTRAIRGGGGVVALDLDADEKFDALPQAQAQGASAFVSVQEGCDKFCTFCVVPYTRGAEYSRPFAAVVDEAKRLVDGGVKEITLLGQNVNAYHGSDKTLAQLIAELAKMQGLARIRYMTSHPCDMQEDLMDIHASEPKLMPYLHLPVQSGSNKVLKAMNRKHTAQSYLDILQRIRKGRPDIAFSSDFIVGFPEETEDDFNETMGLVAQVGYASAYSFIYSPRAGTPAAVMDQVEDGVKAERLQRLQALLASQQKAFNGACVGKTMPVLFDREGKREGQLIGKTPYLQSVYVEGGERLRGEIVDVAITSSTQSSLTGDVVLP